MICIYVSMYVLLLIIALAENLSLIWTYRRIDPKFINTSGNLEVLNWTSSSFFKILPPNENWTQTCDLLAPYNSHTMLVFILWWNPKHFGWRLENFLALVWLKPTTYNMYHVTTRIFVVNKLGRKFKIWLNNFSLNLSLEKISVYVVKNKSLLTK